MGPRTRIVVNVEIGRVAGEVPGRSGDDRVLRNTVAAEVRRRLSLETKAAEFLSPAVAAGVSRAIAAKIAAAEPRGTDR